MKQLVITADDFGASVEVNEAVELAHRGGVLTAASLMVSGPAAADAIARARRMPTLRVGLHVVLVEGRPVLPPAAVSHLVDHSGAFRPGLAALGARIFFSRRARREVAAEIAAQFESFRASGLHLDHCNAHKHFHLHPVIGRLVAEIGSRYGVHTVRVPWEPSRVLQRIERSSARSGVVPRFFVQALRRHLQSRGLRCPDQVFGLRWSGQMTAGRLRGLVSNLPEGLSEIYLHPATGSFAGAAADYRYRAELDALLSGGVAAACREHSVCLGGFRDFVTLTAANVGAEPAYRAVPSP